MNVAEFRIFVGGDDHLKIACPRSYCWGLTADNGVSHEAITVLIQEHIRAEHPGRNP